MFPHCGPSCPVTVERNTEISAEQQWRRRNYCFNHIQFSNHHDVGVKTQQRHFFLLDITKNWSSAIKHRRNHWTNRRSMKMLQVMLSTLQFNSLLLCRGRRVTLSSSAAVCYRDDSRRSSGTSARHRKLKHSSWSLSGLFILFSLWHSHYHHSTLCQTTSVWAEG